MKTEELKELLGKVYEQGWRRAAEWADADHLIFDIDSPAYVKERDYIIDKVLKNDGQDDDMDA